MNDYFIPASLLFSAFAGSARAANAQAPENIRDLETAYQKFCWEKPLRIWVKKDDSTIIQIHKDSGIDWLTLQDVRQGIIKSPEPDLNNLHQEFLDGIFQSVPAVNPEISGRCGKKAEAAGPAGKHGGGNSHPQLHEALSL